MPPRNSSQELHKERYNSDFFTAIPSSPPPNTSCPLHTPHVHSADDVKHRLFFPHRSSPINPNMLPVVYRVVYRALISRGQLRRIPPFQHTYAESRRVTDGARTRDLRSHNPMSSVTVRPGVSGNTAYLWSSRRFCKIYCPLRTSPYQPGCNTVAIRLQYG